ncbi:hypothetical protein F4777DRAFT_293197 [Nemania sp. FL0916]|nr:hypothetical protein F4777DRAFT_293197 [Nemania sp. FL0916]
MMGISIPNGHEEHPGQQQPTFHPAIRPEMYPSTEPRPFNYESVNFNYESIKSQVPSEPIRFPMNAKTAHDYNCSLTISSIPASVSAEKFITMIQVQRFGPIREFFYFESLKDCCGAKIRFFERDGAARLYWRYMESGLNIDGEPLIVRFLEIPKFAFQNLRDESRVLTIAGPPAIANQQSLEQLFSRICPNCVLTWADDGAGTCICSFASFDDQAKPIYDKVQTLYPLIMCEYRRE